MFADDMCVISPRNSGLERPLHLCGDYGMLLNTQSFLKETKQLVFFFALKSMNNLLQQMFFERGTCAIFDQVKYLGVWINASLKDDDYIQRQVKSPCCAANKLRGTFDQCSPAVKNTLFRAYCMSMYACQL